jgi:hypothetical protein
VIDNALTGASGMESTTRSVRDLLREAAETHHRVYRIVDGADDGRASWYADWLVNLSELPDLVEAKPVRSEVVGVLVDSDRQYNAENPDVPWDDYYAGRIVARFGAA